MTSHDYDLVSYYYFYKKIVEGLNIQKQMM